MSGKLGETTGELLREGAARLSAAGSETPRLDSELLLGHAIGVGRTAVLAHPEAPVGADAARGYRAAIERRALGEPVAYLRGIKEFYGLALQTDDRALIPRPETELVVDLAKREVMRRLGSRGPAPASSAAAGSDHGQTWSEGSGPAPLRIIDVGTGSGAIAIALAVTLRGLRALEAVEVVAADISPDALGLARENAVAHAVADRMVFAEVDLLPPDAGDRFDVVLANLPYIRTDAIAGLPRAASFEPVLALDGGTDGLTVIRRLLHRLPTALADDGVALLEIGADQGEAIVALVGEDLPGWGCTVELDLAGLPRGAVVTPQAAARG